MATTLEADEAFMRMALGEAAAAAELGEVPVGAVIVDENERIIASAHNRCEIDQDATAHAEMLAFRQAGQAGASWRLEACTLYVTLEPCPMCMGAALNTRISRIVYGTTEPKAGACGSVVDLRAPPGFNHAVEVTGGVLAADCAQILKDFFRALRDKR